MCNNKIYLQRKYNYYISGFGMIGYNIFARDEDLSFLHPAENVYYNSLKREDQKKSYLLGRAAAKKAIEALIPEVNKHDIFIDRGVFDFPVVKGIFAQNIQVSISHCDDAGIAIAYPEDHPLGVDLEKVDTSKTEAMKRAMTSLELKLGSESDLTFEQYCTTIWTIKEGLSKIFRTGLTLDFKLIELEHLTKKGTFYISTFKNFAQYKAVSYCSGEYVCSVVLPKNSDPELDAFFDALDDLLG